MNPNDRKTQTLERARQRGSRATNVAGAIHYLRTHLPAPIRGLATLGTRAFAIRAQPSSPASWRSHETRAQARAEAIAARCVSKVNPFRSVRRCAAGETEDIARLSALALGKLLCTRLATLLAANWPYRRSTSTWAGGEHRISVAVADLPAARCGSEPVWSQNGKWRGTNSAANLGVTLRCLRHLGTNAVIGGLLTVDCKKVAPREYRATWVEQARGFELKLVDGWIVRGHHVAGGTLEHARKVTRKARTAAAATLRVGRYRDLQPHLKTILVTRADSLEAGNCAAGTDAFIRVFDTEIAGRPAIPAATLLRLRDDDFTRRAVAAAWRRQETTRAEHAAATR